MGGAEEQSWGMCSHLRWLLTVTWWAAGIPKPACAGIFPMWVGFTVEVALAEHVLGDFQVLLSSWALQKAPNPTVFAVSASRGSPGSPLALCLGRSCVHWRLYLEKWASEGADLFEKQLFARGRVGGEDCMSRRPFSILQQSHVCLLMSLCPFLPYLPPVLPPKQAAIS